MGSGAGPRQHLNTAEHGSLIWHFFAKKYGLLFSSAVFSLSLCGELRHQSKWPKGAANSQTACVVNLPVIYINFRNADEILLVLNVFEVHTVWVEEMKNTRPKHCVQQLLEKVNFPHSLGKFAVIMEEITHKMGKWAWRNARAVAYQLFRKHNYSACYLQFFLALTVGTERWLWERWPKRVDEQEKNIVYFIVPLLRLYIFNIVSFWSCLSTLQVNVLFSQGWARLVYSFKACVIILRHKVQSIMAFSSCGIDC